MIPNQPNVQQTTVMPDYYQQNYMSPNQAEINTKVESENAPKTHYHCCVDLSHLYDYHHMHDYHHMYDFHYMHDFHPMDHYHHMHDFHPAMHESWDPQMNVDHHYPYDGWEFASTDYHHEWFHPYVHPHHMHHMHHMLHMHYPICYPVVCNPVNKD